MPEATQAPSAFVEDYLSALLAQASHLISAEFHRVVAANGVSVPEWRVLATLSHQQPMNIGRIAQITTTKQPTLTKVLDRMEAKRLVARLQNDGDRRFTLVRITASGLQVVARLIPLAQQHEQRVLAPFGLERADTLKAILRGIIEHHAPGAPGEAG